jgi:hypothetical protein
VHTVTVSKKANAWYSFGRKICRTVAVRSDHSLAYWETSALEAGGHLAAQAHLLAQPLPPLMQFTGVTGSSSTAPPKKHPLTSAPALPPARGQLHGAPLLVTSFPDVDKRPLVINIAGKDGSGYDLTWELQFETEAESRAFVAAIDAQTQAATVIDGFVRAAALAGQLRAATPAVSYATLRGAAPAVLSYLTAISPCLAHATEALKDAAAAVEAAVHAAAAAGVEEGGRAIAEYNSLLVRACLAELALDTGPAAVRALKARDRMAAAAKAVESGFAATFGSAATQPLRATAKQYMHKALEADVARVHSIWEAQVRCNSAVSAVMQPMPHDWHSPLQAARTARGDAIADEQLLELLVRSPDQRTDLQDYVAARPDKATTALEQLQNYVLKDYRAPLQAALQQQGVAQWARATITARVSLSYSYVSRVWAA